MAVVMSKKPVKNDTNIVGYAEFPVFDEKNPSIGLQDIMEYDWKAAGYQSSEHAIVCLVNTQFATNVKNEIRAKANPKLTQERLNNLVTVRMASLPAGELQDLAKDETKLLARVEELKTQIRAEFEAKAEEARKTAAAAEEESE